MIKPQAKQNFSILDSVTRKYSYDNTL